jgi:Flp pilus assembly protein TadG
MLEFALVAPLLFAIIFLVLAVSFLYAVRIAEHKAAYDAARHAAKVLQAQVPAGAVTDLTTIQAARDALEFDYRGSWIMQAFTDGDPSASMQVTTGPSIPGQDAGYSSVYSVEVSISYRPSNIPGWNLVAAILGGSSVPGQLVERGVAVRLVNQF